MFYNPYYTSVYSPDKPGGHQWLDVLAYVPTKGGKRKLICLMFKLIRPHLYEKEHQKQKERFLTEKGIPFLIVRRDYSQQEYDTVLFMYERRLQWN